MILFFSNKPNPAVINNNKGVLNGGTADDACAKSCESCSGITFIFLYCQGR